MSSGNGRYSIIRIAIVLFLSCMMALSGVPTHAFAREDGDSLGSTEETAGAQPQTGGEEPQPSDGHEEEAAEGGLDGSDAAEDAERGQASDGAAGNEEAALLASSEEEPAEDEAALVPEGSEDVANAQTSGLTQMQFEADLIQEGRFPKEQPDALSAQSAYDVEGAKAEIRRGLANVKNSISLLQFDVPKNDLRALFEQVVNETPGFFYVASYGAAWYTADGFVDSVYPTYICDKSEIPAMKEDYEAAVGDALSWVPAGASNLQKAKAIHDWLVRNVTYDSVAANNGVDVAGWIPWSAYGALVTKKCVCQGYTLAYADLMSRLGVPCVNMLHSAAKHIWNGIKDGDDWYIVDVTWDDPIYGYSSDGQAIDGGFDLTYTSDKPVTSYFMKSRAYAAEMDGASDNTHSEWESPDIVCNNTKYDYVNANNTWGNYKGPAANPISIKRNIGVGEMQIGASSYTYTGSNIVPSNIVVSYLGQTLTKGVDYTLSVTNNKNVGTATVAATGIGDYEGTLYAYFSITAKQVGLSWGTTSFEYDGQIHCPTATATGVVGSDTCTVTVEGGRSAAGNYTARATGLSSANYKLPSYVERSFTIAKRTAVLAWSNTSLTYNGSSQAPTARVTNLASGDTCDVTVQGAATNPGTYTATAARLSNSNYALPSNKTTTFTISRAKLDVDVSGYEGQYDGQSHGITLVAPAGATVRYGTSAGSYTLTQSPQRRDAGTTTVYYRVTCSGYDDVLGSATITVNKREAQLVWGNTTFGYNGASQVPTATVGNLVGSDACTVSVGGAQVDAGSYTATATSLSNGNYRLPTNKTIGFVINRVAATITARPEARSLTYSGKGQQLVSAGAVSGGSFLFSVNGASWSAGVPLATDAGQYAVRYKVQGDKNHLDGAEQGPVWVTIAKASNTLAVSQSTGVDLGGSTNLSALVSSASGTVSYQITTGLTGCSVDGTTGSFSAGVVSGACTVRVSASGDANHSAAVAYIVVGVGKDMSLAQVSFENGRNTFAYTGSAIEPVSGVSIGGVTLKKGTDYVLTYEKNVGLGTATVRVTGKGSYTGSTSATFGIVPADVSAATVASIKGRGYDGKPYEPKPKVTLGGRTLVEGTDYTLSYRNNVYASNGNPATVTITGKGNYRGTKEASFEVWKNGQPMDAWAVARQAPAASVKARDVTVEAPIHVAHAVSAAKPMEYRKVGGDSRLNVDLYTGRVTVRKGTPAGTYKVKIRAIAFGGSNYADGSRTVECSVRVVAGAKMDQSFQVTANDVVRTSLSLATTDYLTRPFSVAMAAGSVTYSWVSGSGRLNVDSSGRLCVLRWTPVGTYTATVSATAAGDAGYKPCTRTVTIKVVVK